MDIVIAGGGVAGSIDCSIHPAAPDVGSVDTNTLPVVVRSETEPR